MRNYLPTLLKVGTLLVMTETAHPSLGFLIYQKAL